tara:strand:- start:385 stop:1125 length:741 start_codon:yes stop_codon:yes gene_type:complete
MKRTKYTIANWKMNGLNNSIKLVKSIENHIKKTKHSKSKIIICPPYTLLSNFTKIEKKISFGGQDCHYLNNGAFTGSISASMLKSIGCKYVIIGHSERRQYQNELSKELKLKIKSALASNLKVIYCIGEKFSEIKRRNKVLASQINSLPTNFKFKNIIIAYEPVWAIGTGKVPSLNQINDIHSKIRLLLAKKIGHNNSNKISILYGGSVNAQNASEILNLSQVDGVLVGGASLKVPDFSKIIDSYK